MIYDRGVADVMPSFVACESRPILTAQLSSCLLDGVNRQSLRDRQHDLTNNCHISVICPAHLPGRAQVIEIP
jgi:hypothetical protein